MFSGDILAGFLSYITSSPPIYGMMYIPLNVVIVALIYQDSYDTDTPFPTTMTQLFHALTRALIRRHLVSTHQVSSDYCMPPSLQRAEDISKLPPRAAQQLLQLARVAYESLQKKRYVLTDLDEDFDHLGMMKKTTSLNVCTGPGCSYSFLHLTLEEYLAALHIAIVNPSVFEMMELLAENCVVLRFLAGMCRHDHDCPVFAKLVLLLGYCNQSKELIREVILCAYECPSIIDIVSVGYDVYVLPLLNFDWYATGYCISHFDKSWKLNLVSIMVYREQFDFLLKGLRSSPIAKGRIHSLHVPLLPFSQTFTLLREFCQLHTLELHGVSIDRDDEVIIQQLITPGSGLTMLRYSQAVYLGKYQDTFITLLFQPSSLQVLILEVSDDYAVGTELIPHCNTNLKELISQVAFVPNVNSLTYLHIIFPEPSDLPVLTNIVQSHHTLEVLHIGKIYDHYASTDMLQLIEAASKSQLRELILDESIYCRLPPHIHELYSHLLKSRSPPSDDEMEF